MPIKELCRKGGFSDATFYKWRAKFGGMDVSDAKRLKELEGENAKLKKLLALPPCAVETTGSVGCTKSIGVAWPIACKSVKAAGLES
jgi:putative transposase